jgi:hypothetical protein
VDDLRGVRLGKRLADLEHVGHGVLHGQGAGLLQHRGEILPVEELHDDVGAAVVEHADVEDAGDVLAVQHGRDARLAQEAVLALRAVLGKEELERHAPVQRELDGGDDTPRAPGPRTRSTRYLPARIWPGVTGGSVIALLCHPGNTADAGRIPATRRRASRHAAGMPTIRLGGRKTARRWELIEVAHRAGMGARRRGRYAMPRSRPCAVGLARANWPRRGDDCSALRERQREPRR